ncbi:hypothetical protein SCHPADRAFT_944145 [Schizopora paradoxa]|uniref:Uncharacterized protein n=1 Tax=Schizopora paradoxa TaxID=27342 RepID=A0A0H2RAI0_9AGAM|nr:hypothetical protein SCHPADRAFT_944145 [Schizopora paradoxa]
MAHQSTCNDLVASVSTRESNLTFKLDGQTQISVRLECTHSEIAQLASLASNPTERRVGNVPVRRRSTSLTDISLLWFAVVVTGVVLGSTLLLLHILWMKRLEISMAGDENGEDSSRFREYASAKREKAKLQRRDESGGQGSSGTLMDVLNSESKIQSTKKKP